MTLRAKFGLRPRVWHLWTRFSFLILVIKFLATDMSVQRRRFDSRASMWRVWMLSCACASSSSSSHSPKTCVWGKLETFKLAAVCVSIQSWDEPMTCNLCVVRKTAGFRLQRPPECRRGSDRKFLILMIKFKHLYLPRETPLYFVSLQRSAR